MEELGAYAHELGRRRLDEPRDDLTTILVHAEVEDDDGASPSPARRLRAVLLDAGRRRQRDLAQRHRPRRVAARPAPGASGQRLLADPERCFPTAVEEIVRYASPVMHMRRNVARDTELAGQPLGRGGARRALVPARRTTTRPCSTTPSASTSAARPNEHVGYGAGGPALLPGCAPGPPGDPHRARGALLPVPRPDRSRRNRSAVAMRQINGIKRLPVTWSSGSARPVTTRRVPAPRARRRARR